MMMDKNSLMYNQLWNEKAIDLLYLLDELEKDDYDKDTQDIIIKSKRIEDAG